MSTTPNQLVRPATPEETARIVQAQRAWANVEQAFGNVHHDTDMEAVRVLYSAVAAHHLPGAAVWLFLVAPPSSGKTEALMPLAKLAPLTHIISSVTPQTFISGWTWRKKGQEGGRDASLLNRLQNGNGIIVIKDFSQVLSMPKKAKAPILADFRDIYDGYISKEYGTGERKEWKGRVTLIAAATPDIDRHYAIFQTLGERFIQVRWHRPGGVEAALKAVRREDEKAARAALAEAVHRLFVTIPEAGLLTANGATNPRLSDEAARSIAELAEFTVRARTHVPRDGRSREVMYMPEPEASPRLAEQLVQLARGSALLGGRMEVNAEDERIARRAALDSIRSDRRAILHALAQADSPLSITDLAEKVRLPETSAKRVLEELDGLRVVDYADSHAMLSKEREAVLESQW